MRIKYLGTAAYEAVPAPYCRCRVCAESRRTGGRALRSRSQALVDGELLIDFNADTVFHSLLYAIEWEKIGDCLITHSHSDHLYPADLEILSDPISHEHRSVRFYAAQDGYDKISGQIAQHDTGVFFEEVYGQLKEFGKFDLVSLDCTGCLGLTWDWRNGHMSLKTNLEVIGRLKKEGIAVEKTIFVSNHFSHNGGQTYDELVPEMAKHGIIVSYDGLEIEF